MTSNRLIRAFRPFAPTGKHSFSGAYVTLVFQNIEPAEHFAPTVQVRLNDIHDAKGRRLELDRRAIVEVVSKIVKRFGEGARLDVPLLPDGSLPAEPVVAVVATGAINDWPELVRTFAPRDPEAEAQLERAFYLRP